MKRRAVLAALPSALSGWSAPSLAQGGRVRRIGFLSLLPLLETPSLERQGFIDGLASLGHVQGKNLEIVYASAEGAAEFLDDVARDLAKKNVELIAASGAIVLQTLQRVAPTMPVVMLAIGDPVGLKLVDSLARPGGNLTGLSFNSSEVAAKRVQLLLELVPRARRIAVLFDSRNGNAGLESLAAEAGARKLGLTPSLLPFDDDGTLTGALARAVALKAELLYATFEGNIVARRRHEIAEFALARKLPAVAGFSGLAEAGLLLSYAPDIPALFRRGAYYVHRILDGTRPRQLPVEQADRFELVVNQATARRIGVVLPQTFLLRVDKVVQ